ncbi:MAG TPA: hypothetical protein VEF05_16545 [Terriglobales bacterium]|nr:hypothetical protein [Terriglobales bacterium]
MTRCLITVSLLAALVPAAAAQARGGFGFGGFHNGGFGGHPGRGFGRSLVFFGDPFLDADYVSRPYESPSPPIVIVQPNTAAATPAEPKSEPLLIEWQGDRYVRFSGQHGSAANGALDYSHAGESPPAQVRSSPAELPPAVLVYRDGHREAVSDYVIASGNLYARGDYYRDGFWTKTVQLSTLDIPATLAVNSASGVKFVLPSGPYEVVTRP